MCPVVFVAQRKERPGRLAHVRFQGPAMRHTLCEVLRQVISPLPSSYREEVQGWSRPKGRRDKDERSVSAQLQLSWLTSGRAQPSPRESIPRVPQPSWQDWLHDFWGPGQNENGRPLVQKQNFKGLGKHGALLSGRPGDQETNPGSGGGGVGEFTRQWSQ